MNCTSDEGKYMYKIVAKSISESEIDIIISTVLETQSMGLMGQY